jgi:hypothetical protein
MGWSLLATAGTGSAIALSATVAAAAAGNLALGGMAEVGEIIVSPAAAWPAGTNLVTVTNINGGGINQYIQGGTANPVVFTFNPPVIAAGNPTISVPAMVGGPAYTIVASGGQFQNAAAGIVANGTIVDGGQTLGQFSMVSGEDHTQMCPEGGLYVGTSLAINVISGTVQGVMWWEDDWHGGSN